MSSAVALVALLGCHESAPETDTATRDGLGAGISVTDLGASTDIRSCVLGSSPMLRIGAVMGDMAQELSSVAAAKRLGDGRIVILDRGSKNIRIFDATGSPLASFGRQGNGPGEFQFPVALSQGADDSLAVWDQRLRRIAVLSATGGFAREVTLSPSPAYPTGQFAVLDGDFLVGSQSNPQSDGNEFLQQSLLILRYSSEGMLLDTLRAVPNGEVGWIRAGDFARVGRPLFGSRALFGSNGTILYVTGGPEPSVEAVNAMGELVASIRWTPSDRAVTEADVQAYRERVLGDGDATAQEQNRLWLDATPVADTFPSADAVLPGAQGSVWVKRYPRPAADSTIWWSFARDGDFQCRLALSEPFTVLDFGEGWVLGLQADNLDVQYVELWPLTLD